MEAVPGRRLFVTNLYLETMHSGKSTIFTLRKAFHF